MRRVRRNDQDLAGRSLDLLIADGEQAGALADDEDLGTGMDVQAWAAADIGQVVEDQAGVGAAGAALQFALPAVGTNSPFLAVYDVRHAGEDR